MNFIVLDDAITAKNAMNGQEIAGSVVKIGFAKVPPKGESNQGTPVPTSGSGSEGPFYPSNQPTPETSPWRAGSAFSSPSRPPAGPNRTLFKTPSEIPPLPAALAAQGLLF